MNVAFDNSAVATDDAYFLKQALLPLTQFLNDPAVVEISVNGPGRVFVERLGDVHMTEHSIPALTKSEIELLAFQVAGRSNQFVNKANPILSASLPTGERIQFVLEPVAVDGGVVSIRKQVVSDYSLEDCPSSNDLRLFRLWKNGVSGSVFGLI